METKKSWWSRLFVCFGPQKMSMKAASNVPLAYIKAATRLADERVNQRFLNSDNNHAELIFFLMIRSLRPADEVLIYSKNLAAPFYSTTLRASCLFGSKPVFKILLDEEVGIEIIRKLPEDVQSRIDVRLVSAKDGAHMIATPCAFRTEAHYRDNELFVVCNFNEPDVAESLRNRFNRMWGKASTVSFVKVVLS